METKTVKNEFIRFLLEAEKKKELFDEFLGIGKTEWSAETLHQFFKGKKFNISPEDCQAIIDIQHNSKEALHMAAEMVLKAADCAGANKGY